MKIFEENRHAPGACRSYYMEGASGVPPLAVARQTITTTRDAVSLDRKAVSQRCELFHSLAETPRIFRDVTARPADESHARRDESFSPAAESRKCGKDMNDPQDVANRLHDGGNESQDAAWLSRGDANRFWTRARRSSTPRSDSGCSCHCAVPASRSLGRCDCTSGSLDWTRDEPVAVPEIPIGRQEVAKQIRKR